VSGSDNTVVYTKPFLH